MTPASPSPDAVRAVYYVTDRADADAVLAAAGRHFGDIRPATTQHKKTNHQKPKKKNKNKNTTKRRS